MYDNDEAIQDYRLTTAEILYRMPDYPNLLQSYLWQSLDRVPDFPKLNQFLDIWERQLAGTVDSVRIGYVGIIQPGEWDLQDGPVGMN
ncbi:MAG: Usg family protein [Alphaproteobacteria bacterium]|nr:MAG: Usg family protein [Alphaproteobacteria bacterium]